MPPKTTEPEGATIAELYLFDNIGSIAGIS